MKVIAVVSFCLALICHAELDTVSRKNTNFQFQIEENGFATVGATEYTLTSESTTTLPATGLDIDCSNLFCEMMEYAVVCLLAIL